MKYTVFTDIWDETSGHCDINFSCSRLSRGYSGLVLFMCRIQDFLNCEKLQVQIINWIIFLSTKWGKAKWARLKLFKNYSSLYSMVRLLLKIIKSFFFTQSQ